MVVSSFFCTNTYPQEFTIVQIVRSFPHKKEQNFATLARMKFVSLSPSAALLLLSTWLQPAFSKVYFKETFDSGEFLSQVLSGLEAGLNNSAQCRYHSFSMGSVRSQI